MDLPYRIGFGYDLHRLVEDRDLILGGLNIPYKKGLLGHSDADCLTHAIADAMLGALSLGDIGQHFPDTASENKDIDSQIILKSVNKKLHEQGYKIGNIDSMVIAEAPKMAPHIESMKATLAKTLDITPMQISIKATTNEKTGEIGQGEAIAAQAVALVYKMN